MAFSRVLFETYWLQALLSSIRYLQLRYTRVHRVYLGKRRSQSLVRCRSLQGSQTSSGGGWERYFREKMQCRIWPNAAGTKCTTPSIVCTYLPDTFLILLIMFFMKSPIYIRYERRYWLFRNIHESLRKSLGTNDMTIAGLRCGVTVWNICIYLWRLFLKALVLQIKYFCCNGNLAGFVASGITCAESIFII